MPAFENLPEVKDETKFLHVGKELARLRLVAEIDDVINMCRGKNFVPAGIIVDALLDVRNSAENIDCTFDYPEVPTEA